MQATTLGPVAPQERIQTIDIIRGIALFGILVINFCVDDGNVSPMEGRTGFGDQLVWWFVRLFMDDRFQTTYCFLFGLGFAIQMQRAADRNAGFVFLFLRRMIVLYLIGVVLNIFTGGGYFIISYYAMVGVLLLLFWKIPVRFLPLIAVLLFLTVKTRATILQFRAESKNEALIKTNVAVDTIILDKYVGVFQNDQKQRLIFIRSADTLIGEGPARRFILTPLSDSHFIRKDFNLILTFKKDSTGQLNILDLKRPDGRISHSTRVQTDLQGALKKQLAQRRGNNADTLTYKQFIVRGANSAWLNHKNFSWKDFFWRNNNYPIGYILVVFLLGAYAGRRKFFNNVPANRAFINKVMKWGLIVGGMLMAINIGFEAWNYFKGIKWESYPLVTRSIINLCWDIGRILMALGYITAITLLAEKINWKKRLSFFAIVGRLGLTNYSLHLFAYVLIFNKFSLCLGLYGKIGPLYRFLFALLVYLLLYIFSRWWLIHFKYGPFEWLWRSLTYLKFQPMRLKASNKNEEKVDGNM
jgi:uncharacterized protein